MSWGLSGQHDLVPEAGGVRILVAISLLFAGGCRCVTVEKGEHVMKVKEQTGLVAMRGKPLVLLGDQLAVGRKAPNFRVVDGDFRPVALSDFKDKVCLISAVPSLDTHVCSLQTKRFNEEAASLPSNVVVMTISMDLPFAQKRFCEAEKVDRVLVLSDHVWRDFGANYGVLIKDMGLLARSVFIVGPDGKIVYRQIVSEMSQQPDYASALAVAREAAGSKP